MTRVCLFAAALAACAPAARLVERKCPTALPLFVDFAASSALLATSAYAYNEGRAGLAAGAAIAGMAVALAANVSECRP